MTTQREIRHVVSRNVRRLIEQSELSVERVADQAGFSRDHLYKILREETDVSFEKLGGLAAVLDVEVSDLFSELEADTVLAQSAKSTAKRAPQRRRA